MTTSFRAIRSSATPSALDDIQSSTHSWAPQGVSLMYLATSFIRGVGRWVVLAS